LAGAGGLVFLTGTLWKASAILRDARARVAREGLIAFRSIPLDRAAPVGFESISSPAQCRDAALQIRDL